MIEKNQLFSFRVGLMGESNYKCLKHHYTPTGANWFKAQDRRVDAGTNNPYVGDIVYFYSSNMGRISHVGIVAAYDKATKDVYTIEGNTTNNSKDEDNGFVVICKKKPNEYGRIRYYGRMGGTLFKIGNDFPTVTKLIVQD